KANYLQKYPGDSYIDIFGHDNYGDVYNTSGIASLLTHLRHLVEMAEERNKIPALTETGLEGITNPIWFTSFMLTPIKNDPVARRIAYQAVWRNANTSHHYAPYPGHASVPDFMEFYNDPWTTFIDDLPAIYDSAMDITGALGISNQHLNELKGIRIFPNPADEFLNIQNGNDSGQVEFSVVDYSGKLIRSGNVGAGTTASIALGQYPKGIYLLRMENSSGQSASAKFIVI
ncbi:MAG: T9SS type A sorting domain-containing protein, partial [Lentimicrobium sp.]|nr:T9SS type A sorting domain-containing protein [Lentimicrobium sp.]